MKDEILTKEDFMSAMRKNSALDSFQGDGMVDLKEHGRFFDSYDKYLNWKNEQYNQRVKEEKQNGNNYLLIKETILLQVLLSVHQSNPICTLIQKPMKSSLQRLKLNVTQMVIVL